MSLRGPVRPYGPDPDYVDGPEGPCGSCGEACRGLDLNLGARLCYACVEDQWRFFELAIADAERARRESS